MLTSRLLRSDKPPVEINSNICGVIASLYDPELSESESGLTSHCACDLTIAVAFLDIGAFIVLLFAFGEANR